MALDGIDHFLLGRSQRRHEEFLRNLALEEGGLREQLADATAGHEAYRTLMNEVIAAYEAGDHDRLHGLLNDREARTAVYKPVYDRIYREILNG